MPRLLLHSASVCAPTGFGRVSRAVATAFVSAGWNVTQVAYDHLRDPTGGFPDIQIIPAQLGATPPPGQIAWGEDLARAQLASGTYVAMLIMADLEIASTWAAELVRTRERLRAQTGATPRITFYFPVDGPIDPSVRHSVRGQEYSYVDMALAADTIATYTAWGAEIALDAIHARTQGASAPRIAVVPLGADTPFSPLTPRERKQARKEIFRIHDDDAFVSLIVSRNSPRKDIFQALQTQAELRVRGARSMMYVHAAAQDNGIDLAAQVRYLGLRPQRDVLLATTARLSWGDREMRLMYGAADALVMTARREGWGLPVTEAMLCGLPVVAPDYGPFHAQLDEGRGTLVPTLGLAWTAGDNRGPGWVSDPGRTADALEGLMLTRGTDELVERCMSSMAWARTNSLASMGATMVQVVSHEG